MIGIYCWTNLITNEKYIGQSIDIERRKQEHIRALSNLDYTNSLYKNMRQYGLNNFSFQILELCSQELLNEREKYWIKYYNTFNNGLNMTSGGTDVCGENNPNTKLTNQDVLTIRNRVYNNKEDLWKVYEDYNYLSEDTFWALVHGITWKNVDTSMIYSLADNGYHNFDGEKNPKAHVTEEMVRDIRKRHYNGETNQSIYNTYNKIISYSAFTKIIQGTTWKNINPELITEQSNQIIRKGLPKAKLTKDDVINIRYLSEIEKKTNSEIYQLYPNVTPKTILRVIKYETWKNI